MRRCKPLEGGNDGVTTWGGNHGRVETTRGWKPWQGGNYRRVETTPGLKPQRHQTVATEITLKGKGYKK